MERIRPWKALLLAMIAPGAMGTIVFLAAGRLDLPFVWIYLACGYVISSVLALFLDAGLLRERLRPGPGATDKPVVKLMQLLVVAYLVVAGLDVGRFGWSGNLPPVVQVAGLLGYAVGFGFGLWPMLVNPFFSTVLRIQQDRGHVVVTRGPYRFVRHPGYAGFIVGFAASPLALGSWYSGIPAGLFCLLLLRRTLVEDRFLWENLPGYREYAARVRFRLVPGVW